MGEELPLPGTDTFQTLVFGVHLSAYWPWGTRPWPDGPRQRVQYLAPSPSTSMMRTSSARSTRTTPLAESFSLRARSTPQKSQTDRFMRPILHAWQRLGLGHEPTSRMGPCFSWGDRSDQKTRDCYGGSLAGAVDHVSDPGCATRAGARFSQP